MALITYEDKSAINENPQIADINKVTADDMNQIKNIINSNYNEISNKIKQLSNVGKSIKLGKNTNQTISVNTETTVSWDEVILNNTNSILTKEGNTVKCNSGTHLVLLSAYVQFYADTTYCYFRKNYGSENMEPLASRRVLGGSPSLVTLAEISEGDTIVFNVYGSDTDIGRDEWSEFSAILLN